MNVGNWGHTAVECHKKGQCHIHQEDSKQEVCSVREGVVEASSHDVGQAAQ